MKRYNLVIPDELYQEIEVVANERKTSVVDIMRQFIKLGLLAAKIEKVPGGALMIRENGKYQRIILI
jgi:hypothetical protein